MRYRFIKEHSKVHPVRTLCRLLQVNRSGYYAWLKNPLCERARRDDRQSGLVKQCWIESGCVYGYRKVYGDLREIGESCGKNRTLRLMRLNGLRAQRGYKRHKGHYGGQMGVVAPNILNRQFNPERPNQIWVTDITMIRTHEGWLYVCVVIDLFSRAVVGWSMQSRVHADLTLKALLMAVWRRKPAQGLLVHSDQGSQFTGDDWQRFLAAHGMECSMSRRGNCHDNAVAESFFQLLKRERVRRRIYNTRNDARADVFDYIELFYNPKRRHGYANDLSLAQYESQFEKRLAGI